ncbi:MAG: NAD-dependent DNA ligase LigA [Puniceicoccales bacterium]|jgi:DNA ligase (NAD+)|nr:NAD-dependent DNA ligase LigA [Puniceicoccales bacterium]
MTSRHFTFDKIYSIGTGLKMYSNSRIRASKAKYEKLLAEIALHDRLYYRENNPTISDFEYDCLKAEAERLKEILESHSVEAEETILGDDRILSFESAAHLSPMMSLANTYSRDELLQFDARTKTILGNQKFSYVIEPKIDGIAINLIYRMGKFSRALTRGNGAVGDDVSANIKTIKALPLRIDNFSESIEIRGEIYMDEQTFIALNKFREEQGLDAFANPRNLAAGTVKTLDVNEVAERNLQLIVYAVGYGSNETVTLQSEALEYLTKLGFQSQKRYWIARDISEAWACIEELNAVRHSFSHWTDGAVLKVNELQLHEKLGATAKSPRWAIAYKFAPERALTRLRNIILQVGRTGVITPVAEVEPIQISGTSVSRATLHNADEIAKKDIRLGDYVAIEKAGEIIPAIISVDTERRSLTSEPFVFPERCPSCGSKLVRLDGEVAWRCQNSYCLPQIQRRIGHFVSRVAMDIDGFGVSLIEKLIAAGKLSCASDIYRLKFDDLKNLEKLGAKSALKILNNIDGSKTRPLWCLLHGLGISGIGEQTAKVLAIRFLSMDNLMAAKLEDLEILNGIGEKLALAIVSFFGEPNNMKIIEDLKALGVCGINEASATAHGNLNFQGKTFVLTGALASMPRQRAIELIENLGGKAVNSISKNTRILIAGENGGSKIAKAQSLGIAIWSEAEFLENLKGEGEAEMGKGENLA